MSGTVIERRWEGADRADPAVVAELAAQVRGIVEQSGLAAVLGVGRLLFERCHSSLRERVGPNATIDALALEPGAHMSRTGLYRAIQVWLQHSDLPPQLRDALTPAQHYALLPLGDDSLEKIPLAREIAATHMPTREIAARVREVLGRPEPVPTKSRRARAPALGTATRMLAPWRERIDAGRPPSPKEAARVRKELQELRELLAAVDAFLGPAVLAG